MTATFQATYNPRTSSQVVLRGGFLISSDSNNWTYLAESERAAATGSNAIFQTITISHPIPTTARYVMPWLWNTSGDDMFFKDWSDVFLEITR